jgi:hypothetical protein
LPSIEGFANEKIVCGILIEKRNAQKDTRVGLSIQIATVVTSYQNSYVDENGNTIAVMCGDVK